MSVAVSLFSGIGGFDLALERAGFGIAAQCEADDHCIEVLGKRFPGTPCITDVKDFDGRRFAGIELICGGFPCQDISVLGPRGGLAGARSGLWFEFERIIGEARPQWCLIENVTGLLSSNGGRDLGTILASLGNMGYGYAYRVLDSQWFGVPQRRRRVFIVGCLGSAAGAVQVLLEPESGGRDPFARRSAQEVVGTLTCSSVGGRGGVDENSAQAGHLVVEGDGVRKLTPVECERLHGFPDNWTEGHSDTKRYFMLGNAVTVPVGEWIARRIMATPATSA